MRIPTLQSCSPFPAPPVRSPSESLLFFDTPPPPLYLPPVPYLPPKTPQQQQGFYFYLQLFSDPFFSIQGFFDECFFSGISSRHPPQNPFFPSFPIDCFLRLLLPFRNLGCRMSSFPISVLFCQLSPPLPDTPSSLLLLVIYFRLGR